MDGKRWERKRSEAEVRTVVDECFGLLGETREKSCPVATGRSPRTDERASSQDLLR